MWILISPPPPTSHLPLIPTFAPCFTSSAETTLLSRFKKKWQIQSILSSSQPREKMVLTWFTLIGHFEAHVQASVWATEFFASSSCSAPRVEALKLRYCWVYLSTAHFGFWRLSNKDTANFNILRHVHCSRLTLLASAVAQQLLTLILSFNLSCHCSDISGAVYNKGEVVSNCKVWTNCLCRLNCEGLFSILWVWVKRKKKGLSDSSLKRQKNKKTLDTVLYVTLVNEISLWYNITIKRQAWLRLLTGRTLWFAALLRNLIAALQSLQTIWLHKILLKNFWLQIWRQLKLYWGGRTRLGLCARLKGSAGC